MSVSHDSHHTPDLKVTMERFQGGKSLMTLGAGVGLVGVAATLFGMFTGSVAAQYSYLFAFAYWAGISLTALLLLLIFHTFRAKWMTVIRRPLETMGTTVVLFLVLFIPLVLVMKTVFPWVNPDPAKFGEHGMHLLHHKHSYLNTNFFIVRGISYFVIAGIISHLMFGWSTKQDVNGDVAFTAKARKLGTGGVPVMAIVLTFAAFDWLMSLDPLWFSTIFGVYYFGGSMLCTFAILILLCATARGKDLFGNYVSPEHLHNLGKLLFAFTAFWAYIGFSQFMLIWMAGLPEETPFFLVRMKAPWSYVGIFLVVGHFLLPFFILLSRARKRSPKRLAPMAVWALLVHIVDIYWLVFPTLNEEHAVIHWSLFTAFFGIGGLALAFALWRIRGHYTMPVKDPFLNVSLRYRQP